MCRRVANHLQCWVRRRASTDAARLQRLHCDDWDATDDQHSSCYVWERSLAGVFTIMQLSIVLAHVFTVMQLSIVLLTTWGSIIHPPVVAHTLASYDYSKTSL